jgi:hypothetical protein
VSHVTADGMVAPDPKAVDGRSPPGRRRGPTDARAFALSSAFGFGYQTLWCNSGARSGAARRARPETRGRAQTEIGARAEAVVMPPAGGRRNVCGVETNEASKCACGRTCWLSFGSHDGDPSGIRTRVTSVKGWCPRPAGR